MSTTLRHKTKRLKPYTCTSALIRCYATIASELSEAGYAPAEIIAIKDEVDHYTKVRDEVMLASGDYIDLKQYEPDMRFLIDHFIRADESARISSFDNLGLVQLLVDKKAAAVDSLPADIRNNAEAAAETIENNVRRLIVKETPIDPAYYETMSKLLDALIEERRKGVVSYIDYLDSIAELAKNVTKPESSKGGYPATMTSSGKRALYHNLGEDELLALAVDAAVRDNRMDGFRDNPVKQRKVEFAIRDVFCAWMAKEPKHPYLAASDPVRLAKSTLEIVKQHDEY